jgi:hypothetical protein
MVSLVEIGRPQVMHFVGTTRDRRLARRAATSWNPSVVLTARSVARRIAAWARLSM